MKRFVSSMLVMLCLSHATLVHSFQNEPKDFRRLKWGANTNDLHEKGIPRREGDISFYPKTYKMNIGDADIDIVDYGFYKGKFYTVRIECSGRNNFSKIQQTFSELYGKPDKNEKSTPIETSEWYGTDVNIKIEFLEDANMDEKKYPNHTGSIIYSYKPIVREIEEDERIKRVKAIKGARDL